MSTVPVARRCPRALLFGFLPALSCFVASFLAPVGHNTYAADSGQSDIATSIDGLLGELKNSGDNRPAVHQYLPEQVDLSNDRAPDRLDRLRANIAVSGLSVASTDGVDSKQSNILDHMRMLQPNSDEDEELDPKDPTHRLDQLRQYLPVAASESTKGDAELHLTASTALATNPRAGQPIRVVHIDPNSPDGGDGTFEHPFNSLADFNALSTDERDSYDIIYVHPRLDGTDTNLEGTITLSAHQRLLGTTVSHTFDSQFGTFDLPGLEQGPLPTISNAAAGDDVVVLGDFSEVSGFTIDAGAGGNGISGDGISSFNINRNAIQNGVNGVEITTVGGGTGLVTGNTFTNNSQNGFDLTHTGSGTLDLAVSGNAAIGNGGAGYSIEADDRVFGDGSTMADVDFSGNSAIGNGTGAEFAAVGGATIAAAVQENAFDANTGTQTGVVFIADGTGSTINVSSFSNNTITDTVASSGVEFNADAGGRVNVASMTGNTISGNGEHGVSVSAVGAGSVIDLNIGNSGGGNAINNNGASGIGSGIGGSAAAGGTIQGSIVNNALSGNSSAAVAMTANSGAIDFGNAAAGREISGNTISGNADSGISIEGTESDVDATITDNTIGETGDGNGGSGILVAVDGGTLDLVIGGDDPADGNRIDSATGAGISVVLSGEAGDTGPAFGTIVIRNNNIANTLAGGNPDQGDGDGIHVSVLESARLQSFGGSGAVIDANTVTGNAGSGLDVVVRTDAVLDTVDVTNNSFENNAVAGIAFTRQGSAEIDAVSIALNSLTGNGDGISILAQNTATLDDYSITDNDILDNLGRGIALRSEADAAIRADMARNLIDGNGSDGIELSGGENDPTDREHIGGTWINNIITSNGGNGIQISSVYGSTDVFDNPLNIGLDQDGMGNIIALNGLDGIEINADSADDGQSGAGFITVARNLITQNGQSGIAGEGTGIDINSPSNSTRAALLRNAIIENAGDGIEIRNNNDDVGNGMDVAILGNLIRDNDGRGIDILNQRDGQSRIRIGSSNAADRNLIFANGQEGVYVVNTSSGTQNQLDSASTPLAADGDVDEIPNLSLIVENNLISSNGSLSDFTGTGLVIRVGTANGGTDFASPEPGFGTDNPGLFGGVGQINAAVIDNNFGGNFGVDVYVDSFTSTVDPPQTNGTWSTTEFEIEPGFRRDPLARLNMVFRGNTGDSIDMSNEAAFYANDESTFKSRTDEQDPEGPFTSGTRRRNATRIASRNAPFDAPNVSPDLGTFLYDGTGASTFRVESDFDTFGFIGDGFNTVTFYPDTIFGELPFAWDFVAPGTFGFAEPLPIP